MAMSAESNPQQSTSHWVNVSPAGDTLAVAVTIQRWQRMVTWVLFLRQFLILMTAYLFLWGTAVLVLRVAVDYSRRPMVWGGAGLLGLALIAWLMARRQRPETSMVRAMLDSYSQAGGLFLTQAHDAGWSVRMPSLKLPPVQWRGGRQWLLMLAAMVFVVLAFALPRWVTQPHQSRPLNISAPVAQLERQIETLKQESIIMPNQAAELTAKLKQITQNANGSDPVKTWESLDHIQEQVQDVASQAIEEAAAQTQSLNRASMLAQALSENPSTLTQEQMTRAMQALEEMAKAAAEENKKLKEEMSQQGLAQDGTQLTPEELEALRQALNMTQEELEQMLKKLAQAGLGKKGTPGTEGGEGSAGQAMTSEEIAQALADMMEGKSVEEIMEALEQLQLRAGGIGKGGGPTDMTWNDNPSSDENTAFKDQVLPPADLKALEDSKRVGLASSAPKVDDNAVDSTGGVLTSDNATGGATGQQILPRHRSAVRDFFERQD